MVMISPYFEHNNTSLQTYTGGRFIEKVCSDAFGRQFRVVFFVALVDGELKGRLVSAELIAQGPASFQASPLCLPITLPATEYAEDIAPAFTPSVSPYFSIEFLMTSQPTRAPSFA